MGRTDNKTLRITQGALLSAIFAAFVLVNRQTAGVIQGIIIYCYALPIAIYTAWYGLKTSAAAAAAMVLLSFILGTPSYAFYSCTSLAIGLVFGECLYKKVSAEKTVLWVMMVSIFVNLLDLAFMVFISGVSLDAEAAEMQTMMQQSFEKIGSSFNDTELIEQSAATAAQMEQLFTVDTIRRILLVSKALSGVFQGFITYLVGSLVMRKLKVKVPKPKSISELRPPAWTGYVALAAFLLFNMILQNYFKDNEDAKSICLIIGAVFYIYLIVFGVVGAYILLYKYVTRHKAIAVIVGILAAFILPYVMMLIGFVYLAKPGEFFALPEKKEAEEPQKHSYENQQGNRREDRQ